MSNRLWTAGAVTLAALHGAPARAQDAGPQAPVAALYASYGAKSDAKVDCSKGGGEASGVNFSNSKAMTAIFAPDLARALGADKEIDADPFIEGQDFCLSGLKISTLETAETKARVEARFSNFGESRRLVFDLARLPEGWRIANAHGRDVKDMRRHYRLK